MGADANMMTVLKYYGISSGDIEAWGGKMRVTQEEALKGNFDIISGFLASPALNRESSSWTTLSQQFDLYFIELPEELLKQIAQQNVDSEIVTAQHGLLKGLNRRIKTLGRSGESVLHAMIHLNRQHDLAKAIDENHGALKWFIKYIPTIRKQYGRISGTPAPGAERYYREVGYMKDK